MARTITEIQNEIFTSITANENLAGLNSQSKVAIYRLIVFVVSFGIWSLETIFDIHKKEIQTVLLEQKSGTLSWYRTMALAFQYGFDLIQDTDKFDNTGYTDAEIEASKVVKYAAVTKSGGQLLIKIASETAGVLAPITPGVKSSFDAYIDEIADCGVKYLIVNHLPDRLILGIKIYRNPLLIDESGMRLGVTGGYWPVEDAIKEYMKELPFNGELVLAHLVDKLQKVEGVEIPHIYNAQFQAIDVNTGIYQDAEYIDVKIVPVAGYFDFGSINESTGEFESGSFKGISYVV